MADEDITWTRPQTPPGPLFFGEKERNYTKQINDELIERVVAQPLIYYPVSQIHTNYHSLYGEAIEKTFKPPVRVFGLVNWQGSETLMKPYGVDEESKIVVGFQKRRITEDQDLFIREGDFLLYGTRHYEIVKLSQPRELFGQVDFHFEIIANCLRAREGLIEEPAGLIEARQRIRAAVPTQVTNISQIVAGSNCNIKVLQSDPAVTTDYQILQDMDSNADNYEGCIIYITTLVGPIIGLFNEVNKFYFNEGGTWFKSPFLLE